MYAAGGRLNYPNNEAEFGSFFSLKMTDGRQKALG